MLDGVELAGVISAEVESNNFFAADRFRIRFAASLVPQHLLHIPGVEIELEIGLSDRWASCVIGVVDTVSFDPTTGVVDVEGRDLAAQLIETQTDEAFTNRTASEIAVLFASRHGLAVLADPTTTPIGRYYQSEHDRVTLSQFAKTTSEWDLLASLAIREGYDLYMLGRVLRFGLPVVTGSRKISPDDCIHMHLGHSVTLSRPIEVSVNSWNSKSGSAVKAQAFSFGIGPLWERRITRPNLSNADAQTQAQRTVDDLKRHEWTGTVTMPGELGLTARSIVSVQDTKTSWDRLYNICKIARKIDVKRGFTQVLSLRGVA